MVVVMSALLRPTPVQGEGSVKIGNLEVRDLRGQLPANGEYPTRPLSLIKRIIVHHTGGAKRDFTAQEIAAYHVNNNGWPGAAYHALVHWDGSIDYLQDLTRVTWHAGAANSDSIGICLAGDWTNDIPPDVMLDATRDLVANLQMALGQWYTVEGHQDVMDTTCPSRLWPQWRERVTVTKPAPVPAPAEPAIDWKARYEELQTKHADTLAEREQARLYAKALLEVLG